MTYKVNQRLRSFDEDEKDLYIHSFVENGDDIQIKTANDKLEIFVWKEVPKWMCVREHSKP